LRSPKRRDFLSFSLSLSLCFVYDFKGINGFLAGKTRGKERKERFHGVSLLSLKLSSVFSPRSKIDHILSACTHVCFGNESAAKKREKRRRQTNRDATQKKWGVERRPCEMPTWQ
jgi:hypothetical protein